MIRAKPFLAFSTHGHCPYMKVSVAWSLLFAGCGIGLTHVDEGDAEPLVERILADYKICLPVWLSSHRELKTSSRVRYVYDFIAKELSKLLPK